MWMIMASPFSALSKSCTAPPARPLSRSSRSQTGGPSGYPLYGDYSPLLHASLGLNHATVVVTSTYALADGQKVTAQDTVGPATHLPISTFIKVAAGSGQPGYTEQWANHWLSTSPTEPHVGALCSGK